MAEQLNYDDMRVLGDLLEDLPAEVAAIPVSGLALDSRKVKPGDVFLAVKGHVTDGRRYIDTAVAAGAVAVIADAPCDPANWRLPVLQIEQLGDRLSAIAGGFYRHPSRELALVGITGTNGKTSCSWLLAQMLETLAQPCGLIGTLGTGRVGYLDDSHNTTPDAVSVQRLLADWRDGGARWAAMEVSSHGLVQHRVEALHFSAAVFTNLTRDHLDYHGSMEAYGAAKARLFSWPELPLAVINRDDEFGASLLASSRAKVTVDYSLRSEEAMVYLRDVQADMRGCRATLHSPWGTFSINSGLIGDFNLSNIVACCAVLLAKGFAASDVARSVAALQPVPGRMQCQRSADGVLAVVDYAHTDDALDKALSALRPLTAGQLHCVFGCGGDRDAGKRPLMGSVAAARADRVVVTSDNPRGESAQRIIDEICLGIAEDQSYRCEPDRALAIAQTIASAAPGDVVLVAGKGHEQYQEIAGNKFPFSDVEQVRLALVARKGGLQS